MAEKKQSEGFCMETIPHEPLEWLYGTAENKSTYELNLANALDVKGGILLAIITLLASDPLRLFSVATNAIIPKGLEIGFEGLLFIAAILAVAELWPRKYNSDPQPDATGAWIVRLTKHYEKYPEDAELGHSVRRQAVLAMLKRLQDRTPKNAALNASRMAFLSWSFRFGVISIAFYLIAALTLKGL